MPVNLQQVLGNQDQITTIHMNGVRWYYNKLDAEPTYRMSMTSGLGKGYAKTNQFFEWGVKMGHWYRVVRDKAGTYGTIVHDAIDLMLQGEDVDETWIRLTLLESSNQLWRLEDSLKQAVMKIQKYLESFMAFWDEHQPQILASEFPLYHPEHLFAGRTDQLYEMTHRKKKCMILVDNKTGMPHESHLIQCLGYAYIYNNYYAGDGPKIEKVATLYLKDSFIKKPGFSFKCIKYDESRYMNFVDYFVTEYGVPELKFGFKPRKVFSLTKKQSKGSK
tara:strand:- start:347 stop:1174 length:828 start_codon:yes stop_codon:yes gene_type:complete